MQMSVVINCLVLLGIFLFLQYACGKELQQNQTRYIKTPYKEVLTRKRRFLLFSEGSSIVFALGVGKALQINSPNHIAFTFETPMYYSLPSKVSDYFPRKKTTPAPPTTTTSKPSIEIDYNPHEHHDFHFSDHHQEEIWMPPSGWKSNIDETISSIGANAPDRRIWNQRDKNIYSPKMTEAPSWKDMLVYPTKAFNNFKSKNQMKGLNSRVYNRGNNPPTSNENVYLRTMRSVIDEEENDGFNIDDHEHWEYYRAHKDRRNIFKMFESVNIFNGIRMRACVLRAICEIRHFLPARGQSLFIDIIRIIFSFPVHEKANDEYTSAMRVDRDECLTRYSDDCPFSIITILLYDSHRSNTPGKPPANARVVICGGGLIGASVAYHLALAGWGAHTVLIEQGEIGSATWTASGLIGAFKPTYSQVRLAQQSIQLLEDLTNRGLPTGWKQCGSLNLARTRDRMTLFRRMKSISVGWGIECELLTPTQCKDKFQLLNIEDILGGLWIPSDGVGDPGLVCQTLIDEAVAMGVNVVERCKVTKIHQDKFKVKSVETTGGTTECVYFVNCAGFWARGVGQLSDPYIKVPLHPVEHYILHTKNVDGLEPMSPVVRDLDGQVFFRENNGKILAGGFELHAKPAYEDGSVPQTMDSRELPIDWDHFHILLEQILKRVPALEQVGLDRLINIPEVFSPDCKYILGESAEIQNYLVAAGMKTVGLSAAGGAGRAISDIITQGYSPIDLHELEISRFLGLHNNRKFLRDRVKEVPGIHYAISYPFQEFSKGRNLRMSPIFPALKEAGGVFNETMGYERPCFFDRSNNLNDDGSVKFRISDTGTFAKPPWFDFVQAEYDACREKIGIADYSSFTKVDLWSKGNEVVDLLQYLCSNDVDVPVGSIIHTGMQNQHGGYENDCSLARLAENHYMMIAPTKQQTRCKAWISRHLPSGGRVSLSDVTSMYTAIAVIGPFTRIMLSELTDTDLSPKNFPFFTYKDLDVGLANGIRAMNLTHTGELGYVLYIPNEYALHVYTRLIEAGQKYGMQHAGYYATRALRIEKFFAYWGQDLDTFTTPLECGRSWRVKFNSDIDFIGRDALLRQRDEGVNRMYVQLLLNDHDPDIDLWSWGGEPIYRNNIYCGQTTTTGYGFTFKKQVCLGFVQNRDEQGNLQPVTNDFCLTGDYEVEIAGIRYPAKCHLHSPNLPTKYPDQEREAYKATRDKQDNVLAFK